MNTIRMGTIAVSLALCGCASTSAFCRRMPRLSISGRVHNIPATDLRSMRGLLALGDLR
jgi:hypothetical protein